MSANFSAFRENLNASQIKEMEEKYANTSTNYPELPSGLYPVRLEKMGINDTSWGTKQISMTFDITDGEHKGQKIFYNGSFDEHFAHGIGATAQLISEMTDKEVDKNSIAYNLEQSPEVAGEYITDLYQILSSGFEFDLDYTIKESKKINPNTNKPYVNKFYSIKEVFEV